MLSQSPAAILFDIDGTLMDDDRAVFLALNFLHASYGPELGLSLEDLVVRWKRDVSAAKAFLRKAMQSQPIPTKSPSMLLQLRTVRWLI